MLIFFFRFNKQDLSSSLVGSRHAELQLQLATSLINGYENFTCVLEVKSWREHTCSAFPHNQKTSILELTSSQSPRKICKIWIWSHCSSEEECRFSPYITVWIFLKNLAGLPKKCKKNKSVCRGRNCDEQKYVKQTTRRREEKRRQPTYGADHEEGSWEEARGKRTEGLKTIIGIFGRGDLFSCHNSPSST